MKNSDEYLPRYIVLDLSEVYEYLDSANSSRKFPTLDTESIVSSIIDYLEKPYSGNYVCATTESRLIARMALAESISPASEGPYDVIALSAVVDLSIMACYRILAGHKAYIENRLLYEYAYRRNKRAALLIKRRGNLSDPYFTESHKYSGALR